ncbi:MAG: TlpA disulfide reductase family protein [Bacteroidales bacterium]|nr:TlpA disulfide reductase family protein [Bacteroidales bacterium]
MKRNTIILTLTLFFCTFIYSGLTAQTLIVQKRTINIKGHVQFDEPMAKMQIIKWEGNEKKILAEFDTDGSNNFSYDLEVNEPGLYTLDCKRWEQINFWAEDEDVEINFRGADTARIKIKNPPFHLIKGGPKNEVINHLNFISYRNYQGSIASSQIAYKTAFANDSAKQFLTSGFYNYFSSDSRERIRLLADMYFDRESAVALLPYLSQKGDKERIEKIYNAINSRHPGYPPLVNFFKDQKESESLSKAVSIGSLAPGFEYPDPDGKKLGPENFRGKILLIDFWASWFGPCRAEIPNLKKAYIGFKEKGVEFLSVSIDKGAAEWKKALGQEQMEWPQILATNAGAEITKLYQFSGIPFIILLDREGKIVAKNLRGEKLIEAIEALLSKEK